MGGGGQHFIHFIHIIHSREKGKFGGPKRKRKKVGKDFWDRTPLGNQTARKHARTKETKRNETISRLDSPPNLRLNQSDGFNARGTLVSYRYHLMTKVLVFIMENASFMGTGEAKVFNAWGVLVPSNDKNIGFTTKMIQA